MNSDIFSLIEAQLQVNKNQVEAVVKLLEEGSTIPFIARYRKEKTDSLDEVAITEIKKLYDKFTELEKRKEVVLVTIKEQGNLTPDLEKKISSCWNSTELEDIYLPYRPKKKTKASVAKERGLEPLAKIIMAQQDDTIYDRASQFTNEQVANEDEAIQGACDIIAEWISENAQARNSIRRLFERESVLYATLVKGKAVEGDTYRDYFHFNSKLNKLPSHRYLAIARGEREGFLKVSIEVEQEIAMNSLDRIFIKAKNEAAKYVADAIRDSYKRLIQPSIETEFTNRQKEIADEEAIKIFTINLRQLLLEPPLGQKRIMGVDPGYRTGCKIVCLDEVGNLLHHAAIFPHPPQNEPEKSAQWVKKMIDDNRIEAVAIGNGTAGRETEAFFKKIKFEKEIKIYLISEDGASIYSASEIAREELGEYDLTVRGAVSIGRRLIDPLAELVKIDPKSLGVGQYQHDVDQKNLKESLDQVVESCVNHVGVDLNTASKQLLSYVSGVGPQLAQNIIAHRTKEGAFKSRENLKKVKRMGDKAFEQCAGFLRIRESQNPLDNSSVHPESYHVVQKMASDLNCSLSELISNKELRKKINPKDYVTEKTGLPTINDILTELEKPGRDPRAEITTFEYSLGIGTFDDLKVGMIVDGIITNITNFGAFVDIGIKENGLVHISEIADRFVKNPADVLKLKQYVKVKIISLDTERKRIQLSMRAVKKEGI